MQLGLAVAAAALLLIEPNAAAQAKDIQFEGSWLAAVGFVFAVVVSLWITCLGALRSDRRDRHRASSGTDRSGPVYSDIDGYMRVH
jgi:membrane protein implicated in regulation of membrane protease activity